MSSWSLAFQFARRYYNASFENGYIRFINRASRIGIAIGVAALIIGLSIMNGFERELKDSLLAVIPDVEFEAVTGHLEDWTLTSKRASTHREVLGVAPYIKLNAMAQKQELLEAVLVHGVDPDLERTVNKTPEFIESGTWLSDSSGAVIGKGLAEKLNLTVGDSLELLIPSISGGGRLAAPEYMRLAVVGIYRIGGQMDYGQIYLPLKDIQNKLGLEPRQAEGIKLALSEPFDAQHIAQRIGQSLQDYVYVMSWFRSHGHVYNDIVMVKDIMYLVMFLVMSVACFNIVSSLTMAVQEKHSDIGILKTMGLLPNTVKRVFVLMGMLTAVKGILWGLIWGVLVAFNLPELFQLDEQSLNFKALDGDVYFIDRIPSELDISQILLITGTAFVIAFLATLYPARKAAKLRPIELLVA